MHRKVEGTRESRLGGMLNPVYFNNGIAVHGAYQTPDSPGVARLHPHPQLDLGDVLRADGHR